MTRQVLIINITRMGDLVQMGALLARLQEEWPGVAVDLVVDRRFAPAASLLKGLREVIAFDFHALIDDSRAAVKDAVELYQELAAWAKPLLERRYDRLINLTFNRSSALLSGFVGAPDIRGVRSAWDGGTVVDNPWMAYFCDFHQFRRLNRFNLVDVYALGGSRPGSFHPLDIVIPAVDRVWAQGVLSETSQWIAVQAGASDNMKAWRPHLFGLTLARVSKRWQGGITFIGSVEEQPTIAEVIRTYREAGGHNPVKNVAGQTTLGQLAALLAQSRVLVTNDTGPMHLAVAAGTSVLDLSVGHVDFYETGPYGPGHWVIQPELDCAPCGFDQVCAHHACKERILPDFVADCLLHRLEQGPYPSTVTGARLYESGVDEDGLGTFRLKLGHESSATAWYAAYWRRYWYEAHTGLPSNLQMPQGSPPDLEMVRGLIQTLRPLVDEACRKADKIARLVGRGSIDPSKLKQLKHLQHEQGVERERLVRMGMSTAATMPITVAFLRELQSDNVHGLDRLSQHQSEAYRSWLKHVSQVARQLGGAADSYGVPNDEQTLHLVCPDRRAA